MTIQQEKLFKSLGLTDTESRVYIGLLDSGMAGVSRVAAVARVNKRNAHDAIQSLINKGLVFQVIGEREHNYCAVHPNKLMELVQEKEIALAALMPHMEQSYNKPADREFAMIYRGIEGFKQYLRDILSSGATEVHCVGAKGGWDDPTLGSFGTWFETERLKRGIAVYDLLDHEMRDYERGTKDTSDRDKGNSLTHRRFLPPTASTNSAVDIFGDHIVTFTGLSPERIDSDVTIFVIVSRDIADAWRTWFRFMWEHSEKS